MKTCLLFPLAVLLFSLPVFAQQTTWTAQDKQFLIDNLIRSREAILAETKGMTTLQWNFKENPGRWSANQIIEHIAICEVLFQNEISSGMAAGPKKRDNPIPDSLFTGYSTDAATHKVIEYTKPFTYTEPMGINPGENNLAWLMKRREDTIASLVNTTLNLKEHYYDSSNLYQVYILIFGHADRHLNQLKKIKTHPDYPQ